MFCYRTGIGVGRGHEALWSVSRRSPQRSPAQPAGCPERGWRLGRAHCCCFFDPRESFLETPQPPSLARPPGAGCSQLWHGSGQVLENSGVSVHVTDLTWSLSGFLSAADSVAGVCLGSVTDSLALPWLVDNLSWCLPLAPQESTVRWMPAQAAVPTGCARTGAPA